MIKRVVTIIAGATLLMVTGCDKEKSDLVKPFTSDSFPQVIKLDDEGDGGIEDEDEFVCKINLNERKDPTGDELSGTIVPLKEDVTVLFEIKNPEGFTKISDYIKGATALYEIDDCTNSQDQNIDLDVQLDLATGKGSFRFPKEVSEVELVFETDDSFFDDNILNPDERSLTVVLTGITGSNTSSVVVNTAGSFKYEVLDDEAIHGDWELDHTDAAQFAAFKELFGLVSADIAGLSASEVDKIEISFEYSEVKIKIELLATETITECGTTEVVAKEIEVEADIASLSALSADGEVELEGEVEQSNGSVKEFKYEGSFAINGSSLALTLKGEYDENETEEIILLLEK